MRIFVLLSVGILVSPVFGFSPSGHRIIAEIAWSRLRPKARADVVAVLKHHPRFEEDFVAQMPTAVRQGDEELKDHWIFLQASTWPDMVHGFPENEKRKYLRGPWHYVNFPTYLQSEDADVVQVPPIKYQGPDAVPREFPDDSNFNIMQAYEAHRAASRLLARAGSSQGLAERALHLCWQMHLIGDAHQPLHSTAMFTPRLFPQGDRGGNLVQVDRGGNLHSLWDRLLPNAKTVGDIQSAARKLSTKRKDVGGLGISKEGLRVESWLKESHEAAITYVYTREVRAAIRAAEERGATEVIVQIRDQYLRTAGQIVARRAVQAGFRMAELLP